jgi:hypothetical protein
MRIPFKELIREFNIEHPKAKLTKVKLAKELVDAGIYDSLNSAKAMLFHNESGKAKGIPYKLYWYCLLKFNKKGTDIIVYKK